MAKYLIDSKWKAVRAGEFVEAHAESGEFVFDTTDENCPRTVKELQEIATRNKIKFHKKATKPELIAELEEGLAKLKLDRVDEMTDTQKALQIVQESVDAGLSADETAIRLIQEGGISFKQAPKFYNEALESLGLRIAPSKRKEAVIAILDNAEFKPEHYDEVQSMVDHIVANVEDTEERKAMAIVRKWAKDNEVELPKKPKVAKAAPTHGLGTGTRGKVFTWMLDNPNATLEQLTAFIYELRGDKVEDKEILQKSAESFWCYYQFADMISGQRSVQEHQEAA